MAHDIGDQVRLAIQVKDEDGTLVATTPVTLTVTLPDATTSSPSVSTPSTGLYQADYTTTVAGRHTYEWTAAGSYPGVHTGQFMVISGDVTLVGLEDARDELNLSATTDDEELRSYLHRGTALLEAYLGRSLVRRTVTAEKHDGGGASVMLSKFPVLSVTTVTESGTSVASTDYECDLDTGTLWRLGGTYTTTNWVDGKRNVSVTYVVGYEDPPAEAVQGLLVLVRHLWDTQRVDRGAGRRPAGDEYQPGTSFSMPNRVRELVDHLRAPGIA